MIWDISSFTAGVCGCDGWYGITVDDREKPVVIPLIFVSFMKDKLNFYISNVIYIILYI